MGSLFNIGQEISLEGARGTARVAVRGWKYGTYLLVDIPEAGWDARDHSQVIGRLFHEGAYHGFSTHILGAFTEIGIMALAYPEETVDMSYRESERFPVTVPVTMYRTTGEKSVEWAGAIIDISRDGCQVVCQKPLHADTLVFLRGAFTDGSKFEAIGFMVKSRDIACGRYRYGGKLDITSDEDEEALEGFLEKLARYRDAGMAFAEPPPAKPEIPAGARCQIQISKTKYNSTLRGLVFPRHVFMDIPMEKGKPLVVHHHAEGIVRFESRGVIFGFESQVIKQYTSPFPLWVIQYPDEIQSMNLRKSQRITTFLQGRIVTAGAAGGGAMVDLSEGGGLFAAEIQDWREGDRCALELILPSGVKAGPIPCFIRSVKQKGRKALVGISFENGSNEQLARLMAFYMSCAQLLF